jgi:hypothetical protein
MNILLLLLILLDWQLRFVFVGSGIFVRHLIRFGVLIEIKGAVIRGLKRRMESGWRAGGL